MRISPIVLLVFAVLGCGSGTQPATAPAPPATAPVPPATPPASYDAAVVTNNMTPDQLALGEPVVNSVGMVLAPIPAGEFQMGSPASYIGLRRTSPDERPQHLVKLTKPFYLSVYEVTQQQFEQVMGTRPWVDKIYVEYGPDYPATWVNWNDAAEFCNKLSEQENLPLYYSVANVERIDRSIRNATVSVVGGNGYRLPTEAEWEYACRAGTTTAFSFGDDASKLGQYAWHHKNAFAIGEVFAHRVGQKLPNPWGLYDMHGNVQEWCQDWYASYGSEKAVTDPRGPIQETRYLDRVIRDGTFEYGSFEARSAFRISYMQAGRLASIGFRPARTYP